MPHNAAACITALRAAMEALVVEVTQNPEIISQLDHLNEHMLNLIRQISRPLAAGINLAAGNIRLAPRSRLKRILKCLEVIKREYLHNERLQMRDCSAQCANLQVGGRKDNENIQEDLVKYKCTLNLGHPYLQFLQRAMVN